MLHLNKITHVDGITDKGDIDFSNTNYESLAAYCKIDV
jgi:hypothetical protein